MPGLPWGAVSTKWCTQLASETFGTSDMINSQRWETSQGLPVKQWTDTFKASPKLCDAIQSNISLKISAICLFSILYCTDIYALNINIRSRLWKCNTGVSLVINLFFFILLYYTIKSMHQQIELKFFLIPRHYHQTHHEFQTRTQSDAYCSLSLFRINNLSIKARCAQVSQLSRKKE